MKRMKHLLNLNLLRKSMCMIAILMKIIPISYCFSIIVIPMIIHRIGVKGLREVQTGYCLITKIIRRRING